MDCQCLIHPFQNDPGTSQQQRVMNALLGDAAKIDARTLADLLDYFVQMSRHINYYDLRLNVNDWQPFFKSSIPFTLASIINFPLQNTQSSFDLYKSIFNKRPSAAGLQLIAFSLYYRFINNINNWQLTLKDSSLPMAATLDSLIRNQLQDPVKRLIQYINAAVKNYGIQRIDFLKLSANPVWGLDQAALSATDTTYAAGTTSARRRLINLYNEFGALTTALEDAIGTLATAAAANLEQSFIPLKEDLQKKHQPHLALLFAFLNMFRQLQDDLNGYTRKHLDYFYKEMLQFRAAGAVPDKAHVVFEIQKLLKNYLVKKGLRVKDGKDNNKQDILFSLDDEIVVNQTSIADKRTLFLNNLDAHAQTYVEGVYMAPVADMADGVSKPFTDDPKNFSTLGAKQSKYADPESGLIKPFPNARLGFVLASPVLSLQAGSSRHIHIDLSCTLLDSICGDLGDSIVQANKNCCSDQSPNPPPAEPNPYPVFLQATKIYTYVKDHINFRYVYLNEDIFRQAQKKGFGKDFIDSIRNKFLLVTSALKPCYCDIPQYNTEDTVRWSVWDAFVGPTIADPGQRRLLDDLFPPQKILSLSFSGDKDWVVPTANDYTVHLGPLGAGNTFNMKIEVTLQPVTGAVVNADPLILKEDFGTAQPLVKVQLNDKIKLKWDIAPDPAAAQGNNKCCEQVDSCCLLYEDNPPPQIISYYHFFRNVQINQEADTVPVIEVHVCGLKNFIVQNDDTVMDVNGPVYPFGTRPEILNYDVNNPPTTTLVGPGFYIGSEEIFFKKWDYVSVNVKWKDKPGSFKDYYAAYILGGILESGFKMKASVLDNGKWIDIGLVKELFQNAQIYAGGGPTAPKHQNCNHTGLPVENSYMVFSESAGIDRVFITDQHLNKKLEAATLNGFLRISLLDQDFLHKIYAFVLARQMMALGRLPSALLTGAVYKNNASNAVFTFTDSFLALRNLVPDSAAAKASADATVTKTGQNIVAADVGSVNPANPQAVAAQTDAAQVVSDVTSIQATNSLLSFFTGTTLDVTNLEALIPNEPWTPVISNISLDYGAVATNSDVTLIHLYPYAGTYKEESINLKPTLFPEFCDEGNLFLGLKDLVPGDSLNVLFELAEATSDSESDPESVNWQYLDNNNWKPLRTGFEVVDDATRDLTSTGVIKFSLPANMTNDNTVMPKSLFWIRAAIPKNSRSVSETTAIFTQAISTTFTNSDANDKLRLSQPLPAGGLSKLEIADANVKTVSQPYDSFGGEVPEIQQQFYVRVSETLRHKGRAIQAFDYERLALEQFPQLFKVKCINHSFALNAHEYKNDFPYAGGYVLLAVIPDLNKLKAGNSFEPKVPVSVIEDIATYIRKRTSPFVRFRAMNPRYEKINFCLRIRLLPGRDENYYKEQVQQDIREFLAPWAVGEFSKLSFGQCVYRSDIIRFLETRDYMDFISDLRMAGDGETPDSTRAKICPDTPRSILIAGNIEVCIDEPDCEKWGAYTACPDDQKPIITCANIPEKISDYCK